MRAAIIAVLVIGPSRHGGFKLRENVLIAGKVMAWRCGDAVYGEYGRPFLVVTMDSGAEFHVIEEQAAFEERLLTLLGRKAA